ncbi:Predicted DNA-binding transcriptional regulator YafY, contains an HTH and WYL domains [Paenibacillus sp. 1_12]|uniref:helix-turn-helix transcriptional regulator n=1 Tax=Paenibacillus sp. 1_12 TaxID=1566278 RepID=UPI0008F2D3B1|nr:YafY family protein [Paenibacillus sp. 1_12]SFL43227.1 Predicted DNA-binding transcriptional regulator YafY, contains an HTH and WYL domains [Paenibacillus sp. 1_12]
MRRVDRLIAILIALQQRHETAQSLADKFEISKRTILRDMQALAEMGVPLYAVAGPKGGFRLMEGFQLPPLQMDTQEALTVLFALKAMIRMADTPFNQARFTIMDKIRALIPETTLKQIEPVLEKLEMDVPARSFKTPHLTSLLALMSESKWLEVYYRSANHQRWLHILPKRIYAANGFWYCEAYSLTHQEYRLFRVDRFDRIRETEAPELQQQDQDPISERNAVPEGNNPIRVVARLTYKGMLAVEQDAHIGELVRWISDDVWEVDFPCPASEWEWAIRFFFSIGLHAEVMEPEILRQEIGQLAKQLYQQYEIKIT